jgi:pimeloyl-ACP methyl ester carboxylesterase
MKHRILPLVLIGLLVMHPLLAIAQKQRGKPETDKTPRAATGSGQQSSPAHASSLDARLESVAFKNGATALRGTLYLPKGSGPHPALIAFHAASGGERTFPFYKHLTETLPADGVAVLLFDRRGSGESGGDFETATFADLAADGIAGLHYLKGRRDIDPRRIGVWGVSQGGWIAPLAAVMSGEVAFVVVVSGPGVSPAEQMDYSAVYTLREAGYSDDVVKAALKLRALVNSYYRGQAAAEEVRRALAQARTQPWSDLSYISDELPQNPKTTKWYQEMDFDPVPTLRKLRVPALFFFGETDRWVPIDESIAKIAAATRANAHVQFHRIAGADHLMMTGKPDSGGPVSAEYIKLMTQWIRSQIAK